MQRRANNLRRHISVFFLAFWGALSTPALAETLTGLLERNDGYCVLWFISPESGDLIGRVFSDESLEGRWVLDNCVPGLSCVAEDIETAQPTSLPALQSMAFGTHRWHIRHVQDTHEQRALTLPEQDLLTRLERLGITGSPLRSEPYLTSQVN
ncbi:MAG: hypothetical protein LBJ15_24805 [Comamonas sp.]|jgi:hypothetical protein|uniref:hypothetical protein n=1 Tax=Comamonas sp. TaxID=34028 RepID=UPI002830B4F3|nr:hypothetical protein [Comamonas sp.]MDR0217205.1 hypothetical protein [Comamonas sp.]